MTVQVALLGAAGGVGRHTARLLHRLGVTGVRLGGRDATGLHQVASADLGGAAEVVATDLWDDAQLAHFCAGARVVISCAGPSYRVLDRVARAAFAAGADYVDPGGDVPVHRLLAAADLGGRTAVLNAGLMPGLTSVLPLWLAGELDDCTSLTAHVGLLDRLTPIGAAEYILTMAGDHGEAQAAWRNGARASRALAPEAGVELPFFPARVDLQPYLSLEVERLAHRLGLDSVDWLQRVRRRRPHAPGAGPDPGRPHRGP